VQPKTSLAHPPVTEKTFIHHHPENLVQSDPPGQVGHLLFFNKSFNKHRKLQLPGALLTAALPDVM